MAVLTQEMDDELRETWDRGHMPGCLAKMSGFNKGKGLKENVLKIKWLIGNLGR